MLYNLWGVLCVCVCLFSASHTKKHANVTGRRALQQPTLHDKFYIQENDRDFGTRRQHVCPDRKSTFSFQIFPSKHLPHSISENAHNVQGQNLGGIRRETKIFCLRHKVHACVCAHVYTCKGECLLRAMCMHASWRVFVACVCVCVCVQVVHVGVSVV